MRYSEHIPRIGNYHTDEPEVQDQFELKRRNARFSIEVSVGEDDDPAIVDKAQQIHGLSYHDYGYFEEDVLEPDGRLKPKFDGTRGTDDGRRVANYLLAVPRREIISPDKFMSRDELIANATETVRMLDIGENGTIEDLPTYKYFAKRFEEDGTKEMLEAFIAEHGKGSLREIAALGTINKTSHVGSLELIRAMLQNSVEKDRKGKPELYLASLTNHSLPRIQRIVNPRSVHILGSPDEIFSDEDSANSIKVTPVLIDLRATLKNTRESLEAATTEEERSYHRNMLRLYKDGLSPDVAFSYEYHRGDDDGHDDHPDDHTGHIAA